MKFAQVGLIKPAASFQDRYTLPWQGGGNQVQPRSSTSDLWMQARTEKLSLWFKSFPNGHQAECFGIVNPSRRISENKIMSANFLFMILLGTYMLYARPVTIPVPNLTQIIFQYTSRLKNDQTAGTKYFISTAIWRNMGWKIRVTKWQIQMILTQKVIFFNFLENLSDMEQDLFNSGYGELVSVLQLSGEIRGRGKGPKSWCQPLCVLS